MQSLFLFLLSVLFCTSLSASSQNSTVAILQEGIKTEPFRIFSFLMFALAILHTFLASRFQRLSADLKQKHRERIQKGEVPASRVSFWAELTHFFGEVEAIFGLWIFPLILGYVWRFGWKEMVHYFETRNYTEPVFVIVIMAIASTRPVLRFAEYCLQGIVCLIGGNKPSCWWFAILIVAPLLGSFITEPAAMTIGALLLSKHIYELKPSKAFSYSTLGLLFVNVSVGGVLTNFAAPPVLMVAHRWGWSTVFMFKHFGWEATTGIVLATICYGLIFTKELKRLNTQKPKTKHFEREIDRVPFAVITVHLLFLCWTVINAHSLPLILGGLLFFLAFLKTTAHYQQNFSIRGPLMVGFFLASLVTHGGLQSWWIQPVLSAMSEQALFWGATFLTSFNDNAAITYLASLVEGFRDNFAFQKAVVGGAVVGGGLTVIANAPNPAGQSLLSKYFQNGIVSPLYLALSAVLPTLFMALAFRCLTL